MEVYKDECLGSLLGYEIGTQDFIVEDAIPFQSAKSDPSGVEPIVMRESPVATTLIFLNPNASRMLYGL